MFHWRGVKRVRVTAGACDSAACLARSLQLLRRSHIRLRQVYSLSRAQHLALVALFQPLIHNVPFSTKIVAYSLTSRTQRRKSLRSTRLMRCLTALGERTAPFTVAAR